MPQATQRTSECDLSDDLIWGISGKHGIAAFLKIPTAKAYYLISRGAIRRLGHRTIAASRSELRRHFTSNG